MIFQILLFIIPSFLLCFFGKPREAFSIMLGGIISMLNLFFLLRSQRRVFFMVIKYILLSLIILFLLYLGFNPIFLAIGFAIFPFSMAFEALRKG